MAMIKMIESDKLALPCSQVPGVVKTLHCRNFSIKNELTLIAMIQTG